MKRRWQEKRDAEGKDKTKPNIIMGSNAQVALEKFARKLSFLTHYSPFHHVLGAGNLVRLVEHVF